jgi:hypothetical protein
LRRDERLYFCGTAEPTHDEPKRYPLILVSAPSLSRKRAMLWPWTLRGGSVKVTPFAPRAAQKAARSSVLKPSCTLPAGFCSEAACSASVVSPVRNFAPFGRLELQHQAEHITVERQGLVHIGDELDRIGQFHHNLPA